MCTESFHKPYCGDTAEETSLCYRITVSCAQGIHIHDVASTCGGLSLAPGNVTDDSTLACSCPSAEIHIPPCVTEVSWQSPLDVEELCQPLCTDGIVWTSTDKRASVSEVHAEDTITYTVTFTNHSPHTLDTVYIFDTVPTEVTVVPGSIRPVPRPGETLETGISMGSVAPGKTVTLTYSVTVRSGACKCIVNTACAKYCYVDCRGCHLCGTGSRKSSVVSILPVETCLEQCVRRCFPICNFDRFRYHYVYQTGVTYCHNDCGHFLKAGFGIAVKYVDCSGEKRSKCVESHVVFSQLPDHFDPAHANVRLTNLVCHVDSCGKLAARFNAQLRYSAIG